MNIFKTKTGEIVLFQKPNSPLFAFLVLWLISFGGGVVGTIGYWGATASLSYWSYLEMTDGVNAFRKLLGVVVFCYIILTRVCQVFL